MNILADLFKKGLLPKGIKKWIIEDCHYLVTMGSYAYGISQELSDVDLYGFCIPPREIVFPHTLGIIRSFGNQGERFDQFQQHHILDKEQKKEFDITIYNIVKYFQLCMDNNPNMIDSLFVPFNCINHMTKVGNIVRENRKIFLSKKAWWSFKGYSFSQIHKLKTKNPIGKRKSLIEKYGWDTKFGSHAVRLLLEVEQILNEGDIDLQRDREQLKAIRRGEWTMDELIKYVSDKEKQLEGLYLKSKLPQYPRERELKNLLMSCLEEHYGSLDSAMKSLDGLGDFQKLFLDLENILSKYDWRGPS